MKSSFGSCSVVKHWCWEASSGDDSFHLSRLHGNQRGAQGFKAFEITIQSLDTDLKLKENIRLTHWRKTPNVSDRLFNNEEEGRRQQQKPSGSERFAFSDVAVRPEAAEEENPSGPPWSLQGEETSCGCWGAEELILESNASLFWGVA